MSCIVATTSRLRTVPSGCGTWGTYNGCAYTWPSTGKAPIFWNWPELTLATVSARSPSVAPVRPLLLRLVTTAVPENHPPFPGVGPERGTRGRGWQPSDRVSAIAADCHT